MKNIDARNPDAQTLFSEHGLSRVPTNHVISRCGLEHVMLCTGTKNGYRVWEMIAVKDLTHYLARLDDMADDGEVRRGTPRSKPASGPGGKKP